MKTYIVDQYFGQLDSEEDTPEFCATKFGFKLKLLHRYADEKLYRFYGTEQEFDKAQVYGYFYGCEPIEYKDNNLEINISDYYRTFYWHKLEKGIDGYNVCKFKTDCYIFNANPICEIKFDDKASIYKVCVLDEDTGEILKDDFPRYDNRRHAAQVGEEEVLAELYKRAKTGDGKKSLYTSRKDIVRKSKKDFNTFEEDLQMKNLNEEYLSIDEYSSLDSLNGNAFWIMGYTANAMRECGLSDEIGEMRERAMSSDYDNLCDVCNEYIDRCNEISEEIDDEYEVEGPEFITDGLILNEEDDLNTPPIGTKIRIINMKGEPHYEGKEGIVKIVDGIGQLHGTWGGLAVIPGVDEFEIIE